MHILKRMFPLIFLLLPVIGISQEKSGEFSITEHSYRYPHYFKTWKVTTALGFSVVSPPRDLLEDAIQAPLVNLHLSMGLPANFSAESEVTTIIVSNQITLGPRYNVMIKKFSANAGIDISYMFGFLHQAGFDNSVSRWSYYPNATVGYRVGNITISARGSLDIIMNSSSSTGENEITHTTNFFNGGTLGIYVEQRLWKNKVFVAGFKDNYVKFYWPTWMLFTTFDRYYHIPELSFSWVL